MKIMLALTLGRCEGRAGGGNDVIDGDAACGLD